MALYRTPNDFLQNLDLTLCIFIPLLTVSIDLNRLERGTSANQFTYLQWAFIQSFASLRSLPVQSVESSLAFFTLISMIYPYVLQHYIYMSPAKVYMCGFRPCVYLSRISDLLLLLGLNSHSIRSKKRVNHLIPSNPTNHTLLSLLIFISALSGSWLALRRRSVSVLSPVSQDPYLPWMYGLSNCIIVGVYFTCFRKSDSLIRLSGLAEGVPVEGKGQNTQIADHGKHSEVYKVSCSIKRPSHNECTSSFQFASFFLISQVQVDVFRLDSSSCFSFRNLYSLPCPLCPVGYIKFFSILNLDCHNANLILVYL